MKVGRQAKSLSTKTVKELSQQVQSLRELVEEYRTRLDQAVSSATSNQQEVADLRRRIDASKPLLETILYKVKLKEARLQAKVDSEDLRSDRLQEQIKQYQRLHELGIKIIKDHGLLQKYDSNLKQQLRTAESTNHKDSIEDRHAGIAIKDFLSSDRRHTQPFTRNPTTENIRPKQQIEVENKKQGIYQLLQRKKQMHLQNSNRDTAANTYKLKDKIADSLKDMKQKVEHEIQHIRQLRRKLSQHPVRTKRQSGSRKKELTVSNFNPEAEAAENETRIRRKQTEPVHSQPQNLQRQKTEQLSEQDEIAPIPRSESMARFIQAKKQRLEAFRGGNRSISTVRQSQDQENIEQIALQNLQNAARRLK